MKTTLYLLRHGATEANLMKPYRLQGRGCDNPLAAAGVRQAELTRDLLAGHSIPHFYASPMHRAMQTARIVAAPHGLSIEAIPEFTECDVGHWEGLSWDDIRARHAEDHRRFMADPGRHGYPGG